MEYRCISADCHIDLSWLPHDLFISNASGEMKDRMPYVVPGPNGPLWVTKAGLNLGYANGKGGTGALSSGRKYVAGKNDRWDRLASTGLFTDSINDQFRPSNPELRVQDQERDGIQAEVMYSLLGAGNKMTDRDASIEFFRIYNDWLSDFCNHDKKRFVGLAAIPSHEVNAAVAEIRRVAKLNIGGLDVCATWNMAPLWTPYWEPLWKAAADVNLPVHFHTIVPPPEPAVPADLSEAYFQAGWATRTAAFQLNLASILAAVIHCGALERYTNLRVVLGESGIGWIPYVLQRMDHEYDDRFRNYLPLKMKPSEYWHRQCRATFQNDVIGVKLLEDLGVDNIMWGSDYPHTDGVFPDSQEYIRRQFSHLPSAIQRKITCENAGKLYGLLPS